MSSPFNVQVLPHFEPHKVIVDGPGIHSGIPASLETYFRIDTSEAGFEQPDVLIKVREKIDWNAFVLIIILFRIPKVLSFHAKLLTIKMEHTELLINPMMSVDI